MQPSRPIYTQPFPTLHSQFPCTFRAEKSCLPARARAPSARAAVAAGLPRWLCAGPAWSRGARARVTRPCRQKQRAAAARYSPTGGGRRGGGQIRRLLAHHGSAAFTSANPWSAERRRSGCNNCWPSLSRAGRPCPDPAWTHGPPPTRLDPGPRRHCAARRLRTAPRRAAAATLWTRPAPGPRPACAWSCGSPSFAHSPRTVASSGSESRSLRLGMPVKRE